MPFDLEFSQNWICTAYDRGRTEAEAGGCWTSCNNGECQLNWIKTDFGGTVPFYSCVCDEGWRGRYCDKCCDMPCEDGFCMIDSGSNMPYCLCDGLMSTGLFCELKKEIHDGEPPKLLTRHVESKASPALIPAILLPVLFVVGAAILVTLLFIYRTRRARKCNNAIHHTDHLYDVFLSYHTNGVDESDFVTSHLVPFLTGEGYTVCVVGSTNTPGTASVATVAAGIAKSRRTILVLSPDYIQHNWPTFESQSALKDSIENNNMVVPLIYKSLDCVEAELSINLKFILKSTNQIQWCDDTADESWVKLKSALPKLIQTDRPFV